MKKKILSLLLVFAMVMTCITITNTAKADDNEGVTYRFMPDEDGCLCRLVFKMEQGGSYKDGEYLTTRYLMAANPYVRGVEGIKYSIKVYLLQKWIADEKNYSRYDCCFLKDDSFDSIIDIRPIDATAEGYGKYEITFICEHGHTKRQEIWFLPTLDYILTYEYTLNWAKTRIAAMNVCDVFPIHFYGIAGTTWYYCRAYDRTDIYGEVKSYEWRNITAADGIDPAVAAIIKSAYGRLPVKRVDYTYKSNKPDFLSMHFKPWFFRDPNEPLALCGSSYITLNGEKIPGFGKMLDLELICESEDFLEEDGTPVGTMYDIDRNKDTEVMPPELIYTEGFYTPCFNIVDGKCQLAQIWDGKNRPIYANGK